MARTQLKPGSIHRAIPFTSLLYWINRGAYDERLDALSTAIFERKRVLQREVAARNLATLKDGDPVTIVGAVKPKHLKGIRGKVITNPFPQPKPGWIAIELVEKSTDKYNKGTKVQLPAQLVAKTI